MADLSENLTRQQVATLDRLAGPRRGHNVKKIIIAIGAVAALSLSACGTSTVTEAGPSAEMGDSVREDYIDVAERMLAAAGSAVNAAEDGIVPLIMRAGSDLKDISEEALELDPIGIPLADRHWDKAMTHFAAGGQAMMDRDSDTAAAEFKSGAAALELANRAMDVS